ncbi:MAG: alanine racemase [Culicoidibacterales bacterium]
MSNQMDSRPTWIEINENQLSKNLERIQLVAATKEVWAVVKADCYHHGLTGLFGTFVVSGITNFCVAQYDEAVFLQKLADDQSIKIKILIFSQVPPEKIVNVKENWHLTVDGLENFQLMKKYSGNKINVHIKVDSGMNRRGVKQNEEFNCLFNDINESKGFNVIGAYTHMATADTDMKFMEEQVTRFKIIINDRLKEIKYIHCENSHAIFAQLGQTRFCNIVRPGAVCFGLSVSDKQIAPIAQLFSEIVAVNNIEKGEYVSYGATFQATDQGQIGIIPIGYADGLMRRTQDYEVLINDNLYQIVGRVCMEQTIIYAAKDKPLFLGQKVEFFGKNRPIALIADHNETIDYEIMCALDNRVPKRYVKGARL